MSKTIEQQFTDWVRKQDPEGQYHFMDSFGCAIFQFAKEAGMDVFGAGNNYAALNDGTTIVVDPHDVVGDLPWTYGALLSRLEAAGRG